MQDMYMNSEILLQFVAPIVAFLLLPLVMAWGLFLALRGIRTRLDSLISLMESGLPQVRRPAPASYSDEEKVTRALRNMRGAS